MPDKNTQSDTQVEALPTPPAAVTFPPEETELAYVINDPILGEPLEIRRPIMGAPPWWLDMTKVQRLIEAFKNNMNITEACISAGISYRQYRYFNATHPDFGMTKDRCAEVFGAVAKGTLGQGLKTDASLAFRYLQGTQPETYAKRSIGTIGTPGEGGGVMTLMEQSFFNDEGKVVLKRQTAELLQHHEPGSN